MPGAGLGGFRDPLIIAKFVDLRDAVDLSVAAAPPTDRPRVPVVADVACAAPATLRVDFIVPDIVPRRDCRISNVAYPFSSMLAASSSRCCLAWSKKIPETQINFKFLTTAKQKYRSSNNSGH